MPTFHIPQPLQQKTGGVGGSGSVSPSHQPTGPEKQGSGKMGAQSVSKVDAEKKLPAAGQTATKAETAAVDLHQRSAKPLAPVKPLLSADQLKQAKSKETKLLDLADKLFKKQQDKSLVNNALGACRT
ncbi:hypothetical protein [Endozoicomonas ascidiicola]|uniref:hypothetical protein n=1 Tax=Endozoicomonas ascidiicola TaxID=1698521 RepID=UPI00082A3039|nr:hypothetical protein [Endozoicomonas ascidiicola]